MKIKGHTIDCRE